MVYTFEVFADVGGHAHGEIGVGLSSAEVNTLIDHMEVHGDVIDVDDFHGRYPDLYNKIDKAESEVIPYKLSRFFYSVEGMRSYYWEFPAELKDLDETELGHPQNKPKSFQRGEHAGWR